MNAAAPPTAEEVRLQLNRLCKHELLVKAKERSKLLTFLIEQWLLDGGRRLTYRFVATHGLKEKRRMETLHGQADKLGYPRTRAQMRFLRLTLMEYYETDGCRDAVLIQLISGKYAPVVVRNPQADATYGSLDRQSELLILGAKTAIDGRTFNAAVDAAVLNQKLRKLDGHHPRVLANTVFIPYASSSIIPHWARGRHEEVEALVKELKSQKARFWEAEFAQGCALACHEHKWNEAFKMIDAAVTNSHGEAAYFWWYTALLASNHRYAKAIDILDRAVLHFAYNSVGTRTDLALLQLMAGRCEDASATVDAAIRDIDFAATDPLIIVTRSLILEFEDTPEGFDLIWEPLIEAINRTPSNLAEGESLAWFDRHFLISGMLGLIWGRFGMPEDARRLAESLVLIKNESAGSSLEISLAYLGAGLVDESIRWLEIAAFEDDDPYAMWFHIFPPLRHLRGQPRFDRLIKALNLPTRRR